LVHRTSGLQARAQIGLCACLGKVRRTATDRRQLSERRGSALQAKQRITIEEGGASGKNSKVFSKRGVMTTGGRRLSEYSVCSHRHQSKEVAVRGRATETETETETETASINSRKPLRAGNPSKSYLRIWAGNPESVVPGSALIRFCVQDSHSHNPLLGRKSRVSRAFYLGCWAGNRVSYPRFCAGQPE